MGMSEAALREFAEKLKANFALPGEASPEDQLKRPVADLLEQIGAAFGLNVGSRTEAHLSDRKVRPDIAVYAGGLICGYIELKAPGLGADAPKLKDAHNKEQWGKLRGLPNLIYTDGREWTLYRRGERRGGLRLDDDPTERGRRAVSGANADALEGLLRLFLFWRPIVPHEPRRLADYLAPLARFLRSEVEAALTDPESAAALLADEWRSYFFPEASDAQFADAYAQTVTYALLLARLSGATDLDPAAAAAVLDRNNGVLALALERLGQREAREELRTGFELLQRSLTALDPHDFAKARPDIWLYFYEDFLAAYDPKLRKDYGVYFTPREVVELQVRLVSELLETRFGKRAGFADEGVVFLDPAVGTGTYPVAAVKHGLAKVRERYGEGAVPARAGQMARNMHGFEILIGPYAVAHLRLSQALESEGAELGDRLNIYLADTLASPHVSPPGGLTLTYRTLTQEHEAARRIKSEGEILVCLGNPPYDRQQIAEDDETTQIKGGWVRFGDQIEGGARPEEQRESPIFRDFTRPAINAGASIHIKNLYNDYVYFWRWALWRMFEQQSDGGIVSFITASSYLAGPGFIGMRETMRRTFDDIWIIDLGGDNIGARKTPNVFNIRVPVAIAIGVRGPVEQSNRPANVRYTRVEALSREGKLALLNGVLDFSGLEWRGCPTDWHSPFVPTGSGSYFDWPTLTDLFPWQHSGSQFKRVWPIGETQEVLQRRWQCLLGSRGSKLRKLFKETRDRKIDKEYHDFSNNVLPKISKLTGDKSLPESQRYGFRLFDRHYAIVDNRLGDFLRPSLIEAAGPNGIFFSSLITKVIGVGPAVGVSAMLPDLDVFCGRGGKDILPLYRDRNGNQPNLADGLLNTLNPAYGENVSAEDLAAYVYALLGGQSYTHRFWNELETPGPRVPITKDGPLFFEAATLGRRLIWLHTYAERFRGNGRGDRIPAGEARCTAPVSDSPALYPEKFLWVETDRQIWVGSGRFGPVAPEIWNFEVSGLLVVQSWLGYRMKKRAGRKSSPLDDIRPERWTPRMTEELLELLWVLEATLEMEPELEAVLDRVVAGPCFEASELPLPTEKQRKPPKTAEAADGFL